METPLPVDLGRIAQDLQIRRVQVENVVQLLDENNSVPFIARYRRERTGGLGEGALREIRSRLVRARELARRKATILKTIELQGQLADELAEAIRNADSPRRLDDLYLPYRAKKKSKATEARQHGLEALALRIWNRDETLTDLTAAANEFVNPEKGFDSVEKVIEGVGQILSESISELAHIRDAIRRLIWRQGKLVTNKAEGVPEGKGLEYRDYFAFSEAVTHVPPHRVLAVNRGEKEGTIKVRLELPRAELERTITRLLPLEDHPHHQIFTQAALGALDQHLIPGFESEIRHELTETAERHALDVFARNLRSLLLQPPLERQHVLALDPARKVCRMAVLDAEGKLLEHATIHTSPPYRRHEAKQAIKDAVAKYQIRVAAVGNGASSREVEELLTEVIKEGTHFHTNPGVPYPVPAAPHRSSGERPAKGEAETEPAASDAAAEAGAPESPPQADSQSPPDVAAEVSDSAPAPESDGNSTLATEAPAEAEIPPVSGGSDDLPDWCFRSIQGGASDVESNPPGAEHEHPVQGDAEQPTPEAPPEAQASEPPVAEATQPVEGDGVPPATEMTSEASEPAAHAEAAQPSEAASSDEPQPASEESRPDESPPEGTTSEGAATSSTPKSPDLRPLTAPPKGTVKPKGEPARLQRSKTPPPPPAPHAADALLAELQYAIVNEAGANIYASSALGREEFPDFDAEVRSVASIGRRLLDPLAEFVKIEPQHLGVGQYQHDVGAQTLKQSLEQVVEHCVNLVGVDLNKASATLLGRVSGLNELLARRIVEHRQQHGPFRNREQLREVEGVSEAIFTQAAGFLRVHDGDNPLDRTALHPESYPIATRLLSELGLSPESLQSDGEIAAKFGAVDIPAKAKELELSEPALVDLLEALAVSAHDIRQDHPKPIFRRGLLRLEDLTPGTELKGTVLNVVDFGAFVDIGLRDSGLVHISQLANRYVKNPHDVVSVGDLVSVWVMGVDKDRRRVSLTMIAPGTEQARHERGEPGGRGPRRGPGGGPREGQAPEGGEGPPRGRGRGDGGGGRRRDRPGGSGNPPSGGPQQAAGSPPPRPVSHRVPGPPQRLQQGRGRGGPGGRGGGPGGRGGPGRGGPGGAGGKGGRPGGPPEAARADDSAASKPKAKPPAPSKPMLSNDERVGNSPLRSFGQLKELFALRTQEGGEADAAAPAEQKPEPAPAHNEGEAPGTDAATQQS